MRSDESVQKYIYQIKKKICCSSATRKTLLQGLEQEIDEFVAKHGEVNFSTLVNQFGAVEDVAAQFQENVDEAEVRQCKKKKRRWFAVLVIIAVVVVLLMAILVIQSVLRTEVEITESIVNIARS